MMHYVIIQEIISFKASFFISKTTNFINQLSF